MRARAIRASRHFRTVLLTLVIGKPVEGSLLNIACVAGVQRGGKRERRAREASEDRMREDRGRVPSPSRAHFDFPQSLPFYGLSRRLY